MVTAAHRQGNAWWEDPSTGVVLEVTGVQMKALDEMEVEDGENPLASYVAVVMCEQRIGDAGFLSSCHSPKQDGWGNIDFFDRIGQNWVEVWRT